jgi:hypothetical protein
MTADIRLTGWRLLGLGTVASIYLAMPWVAGLVSHEFRILLTVPVSVAVAGALVLVFFRRPDPLPHPVLRTDSPAATPSRAPSFPSLVLTLVLIYGALFRWTRDGALGEPGRLALLVLITAGVCYVWYRARLPAESP